MDTPQDDYGEYALFYDATHGDRVARTQRVQALLDRYAPSCKSVLELACGTGSILAGLSHHYQLTGLDISPAMLKIARTKLPQVHFVQGDMAHFHLGQEFDAIFCTFNSVDHLPSFAAWQSMFACAAAHLVAGGLFFFDTNTYRRLQELVAHKRWTTYLSGGVKAITSIRELPQEIFEWQMQFVPAPAGHITKPTQVQRIRTRTFQPAQIATALGQYFAIIDVVTDAGDPVRQEDAGRTYYICRKR